MNCKVVYFVSQSSAIFTWNLRDCQASAWDALALQCGRRPHSKRDAVRRNGKQDRFGTMHDRRRSQGDPGDEQRPME